MKNEENRNPEQQDRLIRETFEQYRAGMESMPSQRAKIVYRMTQKTAPDYRAYYRLAAVAAALVLLLGIVVPTVTGNSGLFSRPDQITGELAALQQPTGFVPMAQPEETAAPAEKPDCFSILEAEYPDIAKQLVPINLTCEDQGIEMEIIYGAVKEQEALFVYSVEDLEGARITKNTICFPVTSSEPETDVTLKQTFTELYYDAPACRYTGLIRYRYDDLSEISHDGEISLSIHSMQNALSETWYLEDLLRDYDGHADLTDMPVLLEYKVKNNFGGEIEYFTNEDYQKLGLKVINSGDELAHLGDGIRVSGIGIYDGMIHLQLKYLFESDEFSNRAVNVFCFDTGTSECLPAWTRPMAWDTNNDGIRDFEEYVFPCNPEALDNLRLEVTVTESDPAIDGKWEVRIPLDRFPSLDI